MIDKGILKRLSKEKNNIQNLLNSLKNVSTYQNEPFKNLYKIKQEVFKIEEILSQSKLEGFIKEIRQYIQSTKSKVIEWEKDAKKTFGQMLENELRGAGFELRGHYPLLKVFFYTLEVDLENFKVLIWYGPQQEKLEICKLVPEEIVKKLRIIQDKITRRYFNDSEFLSKIYEAYRICSYRQNKRLGEPISISDILFEYAFLIQNKKFRTNPIKGNYKEYGRVFFSYDLYKLKERKIDGKELSLITATRAYTRRKSDFLWVLSNEKGDGSCISHIKFKE